MIIPLAQRCTLSSPLMTDVAVCHMWKPELGRVRACVRAHAVRVCGSILLGPSSLSDVTHVRVITALSTRKGEAEGRELAVILLRANETITHTMERAGRPRPLFAPPSSPHSVRQWPGVEAGGVG